MARWAIGSPHRAFQRHDRHITQFGQFLSVGGHHSQQHEVRDHEGEE
ncbi:hypothetical protein QQY66_40725 [Streptomyces sp. DG2A-72]|nr:hypothetical protein [Streptomyces sp. DG2A-72]MDO0937748.1 hypothetical protein [Streptomyces sp. DG2A-72]